MSADTSEPLAYSDHSPASLMRERKESTQLLQWMQDHGASMPSLYFEHIARDYRGVCCKDEVSTGSLVASIPVHLLITYETAYASPIGQSIQVIQEEHPEVECSPQVYVACLLLEERSKGAESYWMPYLNMLPTSYSCMPVNFTDEELSYLTGSLVLKETYQRREQYQKEYMYLKAFVQEFQKYTLEDYIWARLAVLSRIFGITIGQQRTAALVPIADMLNHKSPPDTRWTFHDESNSFILESIVPLSVGDQVYDSYGRKSQTDFLLNYGFVPEENDQNECQITIQQDGQQEYFRFEITNDLTSEPCTRLFTIMRLIVSPTTPISRIDLEVQVLSYFQNLIQSSLEEFDTTIEEDTLLLQVSPPDNRNIANAIRVRLGEKKLLEWYFHLTTSLMDWFLTEPHDFAKTTFTPTTLEYIRSVL